jgi:hypothetical protein
MSEVPFPTHERLGSNELEVIKRNILTTLAEYGIDDIIYTPNPNGTSFRVEAPGQTNYAFLRGLQAIAVHYDEHIVFEIENLERLITDVRDDSPRDSLSAN